MDSGRVSVPSRPRVTVPFEELVQQVPMGVWIHLDDRIVYANRCAEEMLGTGPGQAVGLWMSHLVHPASAQLVQARTARLLSGRALSGSAEVTLLRPGGEEVRIESVETTIELPEGVAVVVTACDVTERVRREQHLAHVATHDGLTGLPNRLLFMDRLEQALSGAARRGGYVLLAFVDLDGFKAVNDRLGHAAGDEVLHRVAQHLLSGSRSGDTVARLAGDEFVVCAELDEAADAEGCVARYAEALARAQRPSDVVAWGASTGVLVCDGTWSAADALAEADRRMYAAKLPRARGTDGLPA
ncbi:diguanylate cyclase [Kineococcus sp. NBC_00420]|uniref:diguanylate cyclase domain-containing protein n=1 Tax=unclassified Kineococcus TaxID=2621656 RepID=UPI002E24B5C4